MQVGNLSNLQHLSLNHCAYAEASLRQLSALPLRDLDVINSTLPGCLSQLTQLTSLAVTGYGSAGLETLDAALASLSSCAAWRWHPAARLVTVGCHTV